MGLGRHALVRPTATSKRVFPNRTAHGVPSGTSAVMVGNTLFDVAVGLTSAVPTETHNPDPIEVLTPLRTNKP